MRTFDRITMSRGVATVVGLDGGRAGDWTEGFLALAGAVEARAVAAVPLEQLEEPPDNASGQVTAGAANVDDTAGPGEAKRRAPATM
mmetsp:Transcript_28478/g.51775  ORF Transcript_28478/g.51775 Transcript_28478/m.51775 type:complete len:87 (-) Transcript_28478:49-309(-)